jgi:hypothetical protein
MDSLVDIFKNSRSECYKAVTELYTTTDGQLIRAKRSKVPYINHIDEGLVILQRYGEMFDVRKGTIFKAMCGFTLHPIFQDDNDVINASQYCSKYKLDYSHVILAMEYRSVANAYLSLRTISNIDEIELSSMHEVNLMLVADKVQNKKDFDIYHKETHPRSKELSKYFDNWLDRLDVSVEAYHDLIRDL